MKTWKQYCFFGIVAIFALSFTFTACDGGNGEPTTYTVTFDSDGGTAVSTQTVTEGNRAVKPSPDPTKDGYGFVHWFNTATDTEWDFYTAVSADLSLKAKWDVLLCTCPEGTAHEPDETCCTGTDCECPIAEPAVRDFTVQFDFQHQSDPDFRYDVTIHDARTQPGSKTLEELNIVKQIEDAITGAFDGASGPNKGRFRNVFGISNGVKVFVDNSESYIGPRSSNRNEMRFHIDYLQSNPADLESEIVNAVFAMNGGNPYNIGNGS